MPYDFAYRNRHAEIPGEVAGYELAPLSDRGLWSIVSPTGTVTNLNTLGLQVLAYTGAGMPPVENITTPLGILGGSYLQRTVTRPRTITLSCIAQGLTFAQVQRIKNQVIAQVAPYNSLQTSKQLKLHYQLVNYCGDAIGTALEVAVTYAGDLSGNTNNLYQDRFDLQFVEFAPPGIKELTTQQPSLSYLDSRATSFGIRYRTSSGQWKFISLALPTSLLYDLTGELWYGSTTILNNRSNTASVLVNGAVLSMVADSSNNIFAAGAFTTPQTRIMVYTSGSWQAIPLPGGTMPGNTVRAMALGVDSRLYIGGDFNTAPNPNYIMRYSYNIGGGGGSFVNIGSANNPVKAMVNGLDGCIYIAGSFSVINSVTSFQVIKYNPTLGTLGTFISISPSGVSGGSSLVNCLACLADGRIVAGGNFTGMNGVAASNIAVYNGSGWQPLGNGLNNTVTSLAVDKATGRLYATGLFTASGSQVLTDGFAFWNGSAWVQSDISNLLTGSNLGALAIRSSDSELAIISDSVSSTLNNGSFNTVSYTGTADVFPQVKFTGPGTLWSITNYATGKTIYFNNYIMLQGETATFNHDPAGGITFTSSYFGNVLNKILPGSDTSAFSLVPGANYIVPYVTGGTGGLTKVELIYQNTHFSFEGGAPA